MRYNKHEAVMEPLDSFVACLTDVLERARSGRCTIQFTALGKTVPIGPRDTFLSAVTAHATCNPFGEFAAKRLTRH